MSTFKTAEIKYVVFFLNILHMILFKKLNVRQLTLAKKLLFVSLSGDQQRQSAKNNMNCRSDHPQNLIGSTKYVALNKLI